MASALPKKLGGHMSVNVFGVQAVDQAIPICQGREHQAPHKVPEVLLRGSWGTVSGPAPQEALGRAVYRPRRVRASARAKPRSNTHDHIAGMEKGGLDFFIGERGLAPACPEADVTPKSIVGLDDFSGPPVHRLRNVIRKSS